MKKSAGEVKQASRPKKRASSTVNIEEVEQRRLRALSKKKEEKEQTLKKERL